MSKQMIGHRARYKDAGYAGLDEGCESECAWHVIWTKSNFERLVSGQLTSKGYEVFLPMIDQWSIRHVDQVPATGVAASQFIKVPMFRGYLFVHQQMDKHAYLDISNTKGVVQLLGSSWNRLAVVPDTEIDAIKLLAGHHAPLMPYPYLKIGEKVRVIHGPMANAHGTLVKQDAEKGVFVVSVSMLQQSVAIEVELADVLPI